MNESYSSDTAKITVHDDIGTDIWYITKGEDSTHFEMVNDPKYIGKFGAGKHIHYFRTEPWYEDVRMWLKRGKSPDGKTYQK